MTGDKCVVLELTPLRVQKIQATPTKQDLGTSAVLFKISKTSLVLSIWESPLRGEVYTQKLPSSTTYLLSFSGSEDDWES